MDEKNRKQIMQWYEPLKEINILDCPEWKNNLRRLNQRIIEKSLPLTKIKPHIFELAKQLRDREVVFLRPEQYEKSFTARCIKIQTFSYLFLSWQLEGFFRNIPNIYASVSKMQNFPDLPINIQERNEKRRAIGKTYNEYITDTDLLIDLDPIDDDEVLDQKLIIEAIAITELLDKHSMHYSIRTSGKGIHLYLPGYQFPVPLTEKNSLYDDITQDMKDILGFQRVDDGLYGKEPYCKRICKAPYSIDMNTGNVCLPITKTELIKFNVAHIKPDYILEHRNLYNHGTPVMNRDTKPRYEDFLDSLSGD